MKITWKIRTFLLLFLLYTFFLLIPLIQGQECYTYQRCEECLANDLNSTCAWCASSFTCMESKTIEPSICPIFALVSCDSSELESECRAAPPDCDGCLSVGNGHCGLCDGLYCLYGNASEGFLADCETWLFGNVDEECARIINCSDYVDCFSCSQQESCGWCSYSSSNSSCVSGTSAGPNDTTCENWIFNQTDSNICDGLVLNCSIHTTCGNCTNDDSDRCGWCASSRQCIEYSEENEVPGECSDWQPKTCLTSCSDFSDNCTACMANDDCGMCNSTICTDGDEVGPRSRDMVCTTWGRKNCPYDCSYFTSNGCNDCTSFGGCAWCQTETGSQWNSLCMEEDNASSCDGLWSIGNCATPPVTTCFSYGSCESCNQATECLWCGSIIGCVASSYQGACQTGCKTSSSVGWILFGVFGGLVLVGSVVGFVAWYRIYWIKRHYYEILK